MKIVSPAIKREVHNTKTSLQLPPAPLMPLETFTDEAQSRAACGTVKNKYSLASCLSVQRKAGRARDGCFEMLNKA